MKWLKRILAFIVILLLVLIVGSFFLPKSTHVERSATIHASPDSVFALVNNLKTYNQWMPWNRLDPNMQIEYGPQTAGKGAWYKWESKNKEVGKGKLSLTESNPNELVSTALEFDGMGTSNAGWKIKPASGGTNVTWYLDMTLDQAGFLWNVMGKWMCTTGMMDKMMGKDFDKGLANMKKVLEHP